MKKYSLKSIMSVVAAVALSFVLVAHASAMTPTISLTANSYGTMQVTVYGDANSAVLLDYYSGSQLLGAGSIGTTDYTGSFSSTINSSNYPIPNGAEVVVVVDGQQSVPVLWQGNGSTNGYGTNSAPLLSQTNVVVPVGQTQIVSISNYGSGYTNQYYVSNTSNAIAVTTVNGSELTIYGQTVGTTTATVCQSANVGYSYGYNNGCTTLNITVTGSTYSYLPTNPVYPVYPVNPIVPIYPYQYQPAYITPLSVSNSNVQLTVGNTGTVSVYSTNNIYPYTSNNYGYGSNGYYVTTANSNVATATMNGSTLTIYGTAPGMTTITVCQASGSSQCATITVTVIAQTVYNEPYNYGYQNNNYFYSNTLHCWMHR